MKCVVFVVCGVIVCVGCVLCGCVLFDVRAVLFEMCCRWLIASSVCLMCVISCSVEC